MNHNFLMQFAVVLTDFFGHCRVFIFVNDKIVSFKFLISKFVGVRMVAYSNLYFTSKR